MFDEIHMNAIDQHIRLRRRRISLHTIGEQQFRRFLLLVTSTNDIMTVIRFASKKWHAAYASNSPGTNFT